MQAYCPGTLRHTEELFYGFGVTQVSLKDLCLFRYEFDSRITFEDEGSYPTPPFQ